MTTQQPQRALVPGALLLDGAQALQTGVPHALVLLLLLARQPPLLLLLLLLPGPQPYLLQVLAGQQQALRQTQLPGSSPALQLLRVRPSPTAAAAAAGPGLTSPALHPS
jgi:hypothetical protein